MNPWDDEEVDEDGEPLHYGVLDDWESWDWTELGLPPGPEYKLYKDDERAGGC